MNNDNKLDVICLTDRPQVFFVQGSGDGNFILKGNYKPFRECIPAGYVQENVSYSIDAGEKEV